MEAARRDFPRYQIDAELTVYRRRYVARRIQPGPGPHTLITSNLDELRAELEAAPSGPCRSATLGQWNDTNQGRPHPNWSPPDYPEVQGAEHTRPEEPGDIDDGDSVAATVWP